MGLPPLISPFCQTYSIIVSSFYLWHWQVLGILDGSGQPTAQSWERLWNGRFSVSRWDDDSIILLDGAIFFLFLFFFPQGLPEHNGVQKLMLTHPLPILSLCTHQSCLGCSRLSQGCAAGPVLMHSSWSGSYSGEKPYCWRMAVPKKIETSLWSDFHAKIFLLSLLQ